MLHHNPTYQALLHDVLLMSHDKVVVDVDTPEGGVKSTTYYLDSDVDEFWRECRSLSWEHIGGRVKVRACRVLSIQETYR